MTEKYKTLRLTDKQWHVLESLTSGAELSMAPKSSFFLMLSNGVYEYHGAGTVTSLVRRGYVCNSQLAPQVYTITDAGRAAWIVKEQKSKPLWT